MAQLLKAKSYFPVWREQGAVIGTFGRARLVKNLNGKFELRGGSKRDKLAAKEWIALFFRDVEVSEV